jgi:hypothetical protein
MDWKEIDATTSEENVKKAEHAKAKQREEAANVAQAFNRLFKTDDGIKVMQHLSTVFIMNNDVTMNSPNINYEAAYKNGEAGVVKYIIKQIERAEVL